MRNIFFLITVLAAFLANGQTPVAEFLFSNSTVNTSGSTDAVLVGTPAFTVDRAAVSSSAVAISENNFVRVNDPLIDIRSEFTISFWLRPTSLVPGGPVQYLLSSKKDNNGADKEGMAFFINTLGEINVNYYTFITNNTNSTITMAFKSSIGLELNEWQMVTLTYGQGVIRLYQNGQQVATYNPLSQYIKNGVRWNFGAFGTGSDEFSGDLDDLLFYSSELTTQQIDALYGNYAISDINLSNTAIDENAPAGTVIGQLSSVDPNSTDVHSYSISGTDAASFAINNSELVSNEVFDFDTKSSYSIVITSNDGNGNTFDKNFTITVNDLGDNNDPTGIFLSANTLQENQLIGTTVGTMSTTDVDGSDTFTYLLSGADAASFTIDGTDLNSTEVFDFEMKNDYSVSITTTDNNQGSFTDNFTISITNVNEEVTLVNALSNLDVQSNFVETIDVSTVFSDVDGDDLTYTAASSNTNAVGVSVENTANTITVFDNDITNQGNVTITLTADDGYGETNTNQFEVNLFDPGNPPTDISLDNTSVFENEAIGTVVGQLSTTDVDVSDTHTYSLSGTDAASFQINGSALETAAVFDFETKNSYDITITTDDGNTNTFDKNFTILIDDIQLEGLLSKYLFDNSLTDSLGINDAVAVGSPTYADDRNGNASSALEISIGNFARSSSQIIDLNSDYSINTFVRLDQAIGSEGKFILSSRYDNSNVPQGGLILAINTNRKLQLTYFSASGNSQAELLSMTDTEDFPVGVWQMITVTKSGSDVTLYRNGEQISTQNYTSAFDNGVRWNIGAVDGGTGNRHWPGGIDDLSFYEKGLSQQEIDNLKDEVILSPTDLTLSNASIGSGLPANSLVGFLSSDDPEPDDTFTYSISGTDAASFTIDGDRLLSAEVFDNTQKNTYDITLTTTDAQELSFDKDFTINVESVDYAAGLRGLYTFNNGSLTNVSQEQFAAPDAVAVGSPSATSDRRSEANRALQISPDNFARINSNVVGDGVFMINGWFKLDSDITSDSQIILDSRQNAQGQEEGGFTISLDAEEKINVNFFIYPSANFFQNVLSMTSEQSINVEEWNMFTITRTTTNSNRRIALYLNGKVIMSGDLEQVQSIPPYDPGTIFTIGAQGSSNRELNGAIDDLAFYTQWNQTKINALFTRPELNAAPSDIALSATAIDENNDPDEIIGTLSTTDIDESDTHTYTLSGDDATSFSITESNLIASESFDFETKASYQITITSDDGNNGTFSKDFVISVNDIAENVAPNDITLSKSSIDEELEIGTVIGGLETADENENDTHSYTLEGTDAASFTIADQNLMSAEVFDFETKSSYVIEITSTDQGGLSFSKSITISILDIASDKGEQTVTFTGVADKTFGDDDFDISATVDSELPVTYTVVSGGLSIETTEANKATFSITGAGAAIIEVSNDGDDNYAPLKETISINIAKGDQKISIEAVTAKTKTAAPFDILASVDTELSLDYSISSGPATISGNTVNLSGEIGTVTVEVSQAGTDNYNEASQTVSFEVVDKEIQTVTFIGVEDKTFGDTDFTITASMDSGLPVTFAVVSGNIAVVETEGGESNLATFTITGAGTAVIRVTNDGDDTYAPLQEDITIEVAKANQTLSIEEVTTKSVAAQPIIINANVDTDLTLDYSVSGPASNVDNVVTLDGTVGTVTVTVSQAGTDNYNGASSSISFDVVAKQSQTITFTEIEDQVYGAESQTLSATSSSTLSVSFNLISGPASLSENMLSITGSGDIVVEAVQAGDDDFLSASVQQTITVGKASLTITADDQAINYGDAIPTLTYQFTGFVNGEGETDLNASISISTTASGVEGQPSAGSYPISLTVSASEA
ncbi:MAG: LamG-like jellyroll fold domain-containing protein, partial [Ekhidna sp.]